MVVKGLRLDKALLYPPVYVLTLLKKLPPGSSDACPSGRPENTSQGGAMNIAIVGGGERCRMFIDLIVHNEFNHFISKTKVAVVADKDPEADGIRLAREKGIDTTGDYNDFFSRDDIDLIIELTGNADVYYDILKKKHLSVRAISAETAMFIWELCDLAQKAQKMGQQLQETRALQKVFIDELLQEDVLVIGADYRVNDINETLCNKLGIPREEAIGRFCYEITHRRDSPCNGAEHPCPLLKTLDTGKPSQATHTHVDKDNQPIHYSISCYPLMEAGRPVGAVEISRDITKDIEVQKLMMQQEKLASIGRLSAGVAHEINNPLTTILTSAMLLQEDLTEDDPAYEELSTIANEALRCRKIVSSLLDFARQSEPEKKSHRLNDVVMGSITLTRKQAAFKDIDLQHRFAENIPDVQVDKNQIQQAVINLILNAVEASPPGSAIHVTTDMTDNGCLATITVRDQGEGIPKDRIDKLFDPFFTTKESGTGLGLAITHGIIEQHGGFIHVESRPGAGTTFTINLPYSAGRNDLKR